MRAPRYRFPEEVRSATRTIAARMVREGTTAETPEQLDAWIARLPTVAEALRKGGYGTAFTAHDLLPLLHVFIAKAQGSPPARGAAEPERTPGRRWIVLLLLAVAIGIVVLALVLTAGASPRSGADARLGTGRPLDGVAAAPSR